MKVREGLLKYISPKTPKEERMEAARPFAEGAEAGELEPNDRLTVLFVLCYDPDAEVGAAAKASLKAYPLELVLEALEKKLSIDVLKRLAKMHKGDSAVLTAVVLNDGADGSFVEALAGAAPLEVITSLSKEQSVLDRYPSIIESITKNPNATDELTEALSPSAPEAAPDTTGTAGAEEATLGPDDESAVKKIEDMSVGEKIKLALTGDKTMRSLFIKSSNKMISTAVMKNPRLTIEEVVKVANSKTTPDEIMRMIAVKKEWLKNYNVRIAMVMNAKTPIQVALRMLDSLNIKDLEKVAKSRYISNVISAGADRLLKRKKR